MNRRLRVAPLFTFRIQFPNVANIAAPPVGVAAPTDGLTPTIQRAITMIRAASILLRGAVMNNEQRRLLVVLSVIVGLGIGAFVNWVLVSEVMLSAGF